MNRKGFTLVEAVAAVAVVAILAGTAIPLVLKSIEDARLARARREVKVLAAAIASQLRDTGSRPRGRVPGWVDATGHALWHSGGRPPEVEGAGLGRAPLALHAATTLAALFSGPSADFPEDACNGLFGLEGVRPADRFRFRGPYLAEAVARKADPWGHCYLLLGYDGAGQRGGGPIWVVSAGPSGRIAFANLAGLRPGDGGAGAGPAPLGLAPAAWHEPGDREANLAVRVN